MFSRAISLKRGSRARGASTPRHTVTARDYPSPRPPRGVANTGQFGNCTVLNNYDK